MDSCPISELVIVHDSGLPVFAWLNPSKKEIATGVTDTNSQNLMSGLFTAILTMSEDISGESAAIKSLKMLRATFKYAIKGNLIFILGYDSNASEYESIVDNFLSDIISDFSKQYADHLTDDMLLDGDIFSNFSSYMEQGIADSRWKIERTDQEVLDNIHELLMDIVGPVGTQMYDNNLRKQIQYRKRRVIDFTQFAKDIVYEMSLLMDPAQAKQIGDEIRNIIRTR